MRLKITKRTWILFGAIFVIGLEILSLFAYGVLQAAKPSTGGTTLPNQDIVNYEIPFDQENALLAKGVTILKFYQTNNCLNCSDQKTFLEYLANNYKGSFFLEEIQSNKTVDYPSLLISSSGHDSVTLNGADYSQILDKLCDLMSQPPVEFRCAVRNV